MLLIDCVGRTKAIGTSTFVMSALDHKEPFIQTLNLGDSGFMILRHKSEDTTISPLDSAH